MWRGLLGGIPDVPPLLVDVAPLPFHDDRIEPGGSSSPPFEGAADARRRDSRAIGTHACGRTRPFIRVSFPSAYPAGRRSAMVAIVAQDGRRSPSHVMFPSIDERKMHLYWGYPIIRGIAPSRYRVGDAGQGNEAGTPP